MCTTAMQRSLEVKINWSLWHEDSTSSCPMPSRCYKCVACNVMSSNHILQRGQSVYASKMNISVATERSTYIEKSDSPGSPSDLTDQAVAIYKIDRCVGCTYRAMNLLVPFWSSWSSCSNSPHGIEALDMYRSQWISWSLSWSPWSSCRRLGSCSPCTSSHIVACQDELSNTMPHLLWLLSIWILHQEKKHTCSCFRILIVIAVVQHWSPFWSPDEAVAIYNNE